MSAHNLANRLRKAGSIALLPALCALTACQQQGDSAARQAQDEPPALGEEQAVAIPPLELLEGNCEAASHVALVDAWDIAIAEKIHADDGTLGYVVEKVSANLLEFYKGDFGDSLQIAYYSFLEYPTEPESFRLDTLLVFLRQDPANKNFLAIEVGQFRYSDSLGRIIESICQGE